MLLSRDNHIKPISGKGEWRFQGRNVTFLILNDCK